MIGAAWNWIVAHLHYALPVAAVILGAIFVRAARSSDDDTGPSR